MLVRLLVPAFAVVALTGCTLAPPSASQAPAPGATPSQALAARIVAVGIPGAAGITPVGQFHAGGPIHDKPNFAVSTQPGAMLDPERVLVTSSSNFGLPRARDDQATGAVLSIDPRGASPLVVPPTFAAGGGQASALNGAVLMFTAQSPAFLNSLTKPGAVTADQPGTSSPVGISINNAFGRVWLANTPMGRAAWAARRSSTRTVDRSPTRRANAPAASSRVR